jgi:hypothetical protein
LASKPVLTIFSDFGLKPVATVFRFGAQNRQLQFDDLYLKITETVSYFGPQNQAGFDLSVTLQNRRRDDDAEHASRSGS